mmetsp:Transcript_82021/g.240787  ORF Transcript_82021/g.240787 Transcript_82021/m.240787 type:complete len:632 (-) Transcript_82021:19-1914(-)
MSGSPATELVSNDSSDESVKVHGHRRPLCLSLSAAEWRHEILCGVTVGLALIPEAVSFALAGGLKPAVGLNSAWIIAIITGVLGGRPGMICGATGSLAVLIGPTVMEGKEYLFYAVMLMGLLQIVLGLAQVGSLVKLIPSSVMMGFCNGLALVIGLAQFNNFKVPNLHESADVRRLGSFDAFTDGKPFISGIEGMFAGLITTLSFFTCLFLPKLTTRVPSALVAVVLGTALEWAVVRGLGKSETTTVGDIAALKFLSNFPIPLWFDSQYTPKPLNLDTLEQVSTLAVTMAAVGLLESLMTLNLIDELTRSGRSSTRRECVGQGVANIVCGAFAGMGGCAMIGQSMINIGSGARHRVSSITAGVSLLIIVVVAGPAINCIPVSALVGVMFNVVFHTFDWKSLKLMVLAAMPEKMRRKVFSKTTSEKKIRRFDAVIILAVTLVTLFTDLATAVGVGMLLALFSFALESSELISIVPRHGGNGTNPGEKVYEVHGILFFGSTSKFLELFDEENDPEVVHLVFEAGYIMDFSALEALNKLGERYGALGKRLTLQELKPRSSRLVSNAAGLLVEEITLSGDGEEVVPQEREHLHVERFPGIDPTLVMSEAEASLLWSGVRERAHEVQTDSEDGEDN